MKRSYNVPIGWSKGEPLVVQKLGETCYHLIRSGGYLQVPGAPFSKYSPGYLEFSSRNAMRKFQEWWDAPDPDRPNEYEITRAEYLEYVQEVINFAPRGFSGSLDFIFPGLSPGGAQLVYKGCTEAEAAALKQAHATYERAVQQILFPDKEDDHED